MPAKCSPSKRHPLRALCAALVTASLGAEAAAREISSAGGPGGSAAGVLWGDWIVIGLYALGMLAIGWYYSRRSRTREDYLLGSRRMNPLMVGLSLFATMLSTVTYLALPGEMIKYGPILALGKLASYPLIALVVGWFLIPYIMRLRVTSAYEILEVRLGLGVRMLGSTFFLSLRLMWMAVVVYATSSKVLIPLMGLDSSATPWLCAAMGLITVAYTSMGGLRAVVVTDAIQSGILFAGAILTILVVNHCAGGFWQWWPSEWPEHWPAAKWGYDPNSRVTFAGALISTFVWYVCTSGSDQMAIQRYLATKDARSARRTLIYALSASGLTLVLVSVVGLALLAYFQQDPSMLLDGQGITADADQLFPHFIAYGFPPGVTGLVLAGLLAAAMSSLSSGVNSSCSVITVDFIERFRRGERSEDGQVKTAKIASLAVGAVVVLLSSLVGLVEGNLLEIAYKVCNLLTAPLFGLFFMALFVRWATGAGTLVGAAFGLATVVAINFWYEITGTPGISFLWAMPLGLAIQVGVGMLVSLIPVGRGKPLEEITEP